MMKLLQMFLIVVLVTASLSMAGETNDRHEDNEKNYFFEKRYFDLKSSIDEIRYELNYKIKSQDSIIEKQDELITDLRLKINDLEHELFQATQSLRNLELEVWDLKDSSGEKPIASGK